MTVTRRFANQDRILTQVVERLRDQIDQYGDANCFITDQEVPSSWPSGTLCCTVCLGDAVYPEQFFSGGGHAQVGKQTHLKVSPWLRSNLDRNPDFEATLIGGEDGLVSVFERRILKALLCHEKDGRTVAWEPSGPEGQALLANQISPVSSTAPRPAGENDEFVGMTIRFELLFLWDL